MIESNVLIWSIGLTIGFPMLVILLGELIHWLQRRGRPLAATLRAIRNQVLPVLVVLLFMQHVLELDADGRLLKSIGTLFWICVIDASLSLLNSLFFEQAEADTWRARVPKLLIDLSRLLLVLLGTAIVLAVVWKADLAGVVTALGVSSLVIGLALQDTLGSVMSGIALLFERPFTVGDWLRVGDLVGQVIDINWRAVRLQTLQREMVIIPHKVISGEIIRNFSRPLRLHAERIQIGFSYNDPPNLAIQVLRSTALSTQGILNDPEPQIFTLSYDDSAITYEVKFFIEDYSDLEEIRSRFMTRVWYAAQRSNLTIPFPIRTLYHFHGPTSKAEKTSKKFAESLQSVPPFVPLGRKEDLGGLAEEIILQHFGRGEKALTEGNPGNALYIILSGQAMITARDEIGQEQDVLPLKAGEFFGEMALFSGEPSTISVTATDDLEVMMISASVVNQMIERQPSFAREIGQILEIRRRAVQAVKQIRTGGLQ
ncbi:mechanosensitive ion channel family protein [Leptolyngbya sp. 'hensonii']|uniref:mechanosensitive ion channel family protein n=1 Tax=Leptolyngbya sp. 'hensonii' TaxID=1922337 RepID=UPI00209A8C13|nr:mechanosensitive ion channel family protein [Leptolyngbya sp. 'hensonii']